MTKYIFILSISFIFFNCKNDINSKLITIETNKIDYSINNKNDINASSESFEKFFIKFSNDSLFQVSRINFPINVVEFNSEKIIEETIELNRENYYFQNIRKNSKDYTIEKKIKQFDATVYLKGIEKGIYMELFFEKKNGHWFLKTWNNFST